MSEQTGSCWASEELRTLFLFEELTDEQLGWLSENGRTARPGPAARRSTEGEPATCFFVLLSGTMSMHRRSRTPRSRRCAPTSAASTPAPPRPSSQSATNEPYATSARAITDCEFWVIGAAEFGDQIREWFPMAMHMLEGLTLGMRSSQAMVGQRERLLSLGPAVGRADPRAQQPGRRRRARHRRRCASGSAGCAASSPIWPPPGVDPKALMALTDLQEAAVERMAKAEQLLRRCRSARPRTN